MAKAKKVQITLSKNSSFVGRIKYLILTWKKMETRIALVIGFFTGSIPPVGSYIVFHFLIYRMTGLGLAAAVISGIACFVVSLLNVSKLMTELTKSAIQGWCYAILLECLAMFVTGPGWVTVFTLISLAVVVMANWIKMSHNGLLRTE